MINDKDARHPYVQLADQLRERIKAGEITDMLPSILELTDSTGLALNTVRRAIKILIDEDLVYTVQGRGTFVKPKS